MSLRIALLVPHLFMSEDLLKNTIFSPGTIAIDLANGLVKLGHRVSVFSPSCVKTLLNNKVLNITSDWSLIRNELDLRGYDLHTLMQKHPLTYLTLARQLQSELIARAYEMANNNEFDIVHVWINEEDIALNFAKLCHKPTIFTHHDPFNFLTKYRTSFEKYKDLNWVSISYAQRETIKTTPSPRNTSPLIKGRRATGKSEMVGGVNWIGNVYHGTKPLCTAWEIKPKSERKYFAFLGRIIEAKGVHLAINAVQKYNTNSKEKVPLFIAGKHYSSPNKASYWDTKIKPQIDDETIKYVGYVDGNDMKKEFLKNAKALIVPSIFDEPFGMIMIEALSCGTPIIGLDNGAIPEIIINGINGFVAKTIRSNVETRHGSSLQEKIDEKKTVDHLVDTLKRIEVIDNEKCYEIFKDRFTTVRMCKEYEDVYRKALGLKP